MPNGVSEFERHIFGEGYNGNLTLDILGDEMPYPSLAILTIYYESLALNGSISERKRAVQNLNVILQQYTLKLNQVEEAVKAEIAHQHALEAAASEGMCHNHE